MTFAPGFRRRDNLNYGSVCLLPWPGFIVGTAARGGTSSWLQDCWLILPVQRSTTMFGWIRQLSEKWAVFPLTRSPLLVELLERLSNLFELILINACR